MGINLTTKTKNQPDLKKIGYSSFLFYFIIILGATIVFVAPLIHIGFPEENNNVSLYESEIGRSIDDIEKQIFYLRQEYDNGLISAEDFIIKNDALLNLKDNTVIKNKRLLNQKIDSERVFGWKTVRLFLVGFGVRLPYLLFSLIISFLVYKCKSKDKYFNHVFTLVQVICYASALYQIIWCFWYSQDYPLSAYLYFFLAICLMVSTAGVYFITYREIFKHNLEYQLDKVQKALNAISRFAFIGVKKFIRIDSMKDYKKESIEILKDGMNGK